MLQPEFLNSLGFEENPFQFTNADDEEYLQRYFLPPPYFDAVWGDSRSPVSHVIFAPRGGGKTAQRKMIEHQATKDNVFAITYDRFDHLSGKDLEQLSVGSHLRSIIQLSLMGFLLEVRDRVLSPSVFRGIERQQIEWLCKLYIGDLTATEAMEALRSLRTISSKARRLLADWGAPISSLVSMILKSHGLAGVNVSVPVGHELTDTNSTSKMHLEIVRDLLIGIGFRSVYVLVDKVDETDFAGNDAYKSFLVIRPLVRDLDLLQTKGIGFKFFLWDKLKPYYDKYGRPDRVDQFALSWTHEELNEMLSKRMGAFSQGRVKNIGKLTDTYLVRALQSLVVMFAAGSPRDMIRVCQKIVSEQMKLNANPVLSSKFIELEAIEAGILDFARQRAGELAGEETLRDMLKIGEVDFTTNHLASSVLKVGVNSARNKIEKWLQKGIVERIGEKRVGNGRPVYHYAVSDIRVARAMLPRMTLSEFLSSKVLNCDSCSRVSIRHWPAGERRCPACGDRPAISEHSF
jgi:hypothetical protein